MTHDPLCRFSKAAPVDDDHEDCEYCELIAAVRADMVQRVANLGYYIDSSDPFEQGYTIGREMAINALSNALIGS